MVFFAEMSNVQVPLCCIAVSCGEDHSSCECVCARVWSLPATPVTADGTVLKDKDVKRVTTHKLLSFKHICRVFYILYIYCIVYIFMF